MNASRKAKTDETRGPKALRSARVNHQIIRRGQKKAIAAVRQYKGCVTRDRITGRKRNNMTQRALVTCDQEPLQALLGEHSLH